MLDTMYRAHAFAPAATSVILYGESGTGKTFFAEYIHLVSRRPDGFHPLSVGILEPQLARDELFGHVRGAFTDANRIRDGLLATAGAGTVLLDDMQTVDLGMQKQLLQVLDRGTYKAVGSDRRVAIACRIIFAMTEHPDALMEHGLLLKDLRYRCGACAIGIPPLRERRVEIPSLAQRALERCPQLTTVDGPARFSDAALKALCDAEYKGNVRQLEGIVVAAYLMARFAGAAEIRSEHLPEEVGPPLRYRRRGNPIANRIAIERALMRTGGNIKRAAELLGVSRNVVHAILAVRTGTA